METKKPWKKEIKGYAVLAGSTPYTPNEYLGCMSIFRTKKEAEYWRDTRVHKNNRKPVVKAVITLTI